MSIESPSPAALPRFNVRPYVADGGFNFGGVLMLAAALILAGAAMGLVAHFVSRAIYLIIVFPVAIGLGVGAVGMRMVKAGRVRNAFIGGVSGFLAGVLAMAMMHYFDYRHFRSELEKQEGGAAILKIAQLPPGEQEKVFALVKPEAREDVRHAVKAVSSFAGFIDYSAFLGVSIQSTHSYSSKDKGLNLGYIGSYIYWIVEILIVAGFTFAMVRRSTAEPFCRDCDQWKRSKILGSLDPAAGVAAIRSGDLTLIQAAKPNPSQGPLRVSVAACDQCATSGDVDVKVDQLTQNKQGKTQVKNMAHVSYPAEALPYLLQLFTPQPAPVAAPPEPPTVG